MTKQERDLFRLRKEVELLVAQLDHIAEYVPHIEWEGQKIEFRELSQRALSRYQLERQREIQETYAWRLRDFVASHFTDKQDSSDP
ncbi:hypothetical protein BH09VER1_BH09VER1_01140 [soil metagenome]